MACAVRRSAVVLWLLGCQLSGQEAPSAPAATEKGEAAYRAVLARTREWLGEYPDLVSRVELGRSAGGRPLFALRVGCREDGPAEVYLGAGIHGSEGSEQDALWMVDRLLAHSNDPGVAALLRTRVVWVQPLVNPDGVVAQQRKNHNGVDLNRNFSARWRAMARPQARDYPGPAPFSEAETRAVRDLLVGRSRLRVSLDLHRSAEALVAAQCGDAGVVDDRVQEAAEALNGAMGKLRLGVLHLPQMRGLSIDWVWNALGVFAFTMENGSGVARAPADDPRWLGLLHLLEHATDYPRRSGDEPSVSYPWLVTRRTRADELELERLEAPGQVLFRDGFESDASFESYFEILGLDGNRVHIAHDPKLVHTGAGSLQLTSAASGGEPSGAGPRLWLGGDGHEVVHLRYWIRYAPDYDQGNLHHTGGAIAGVAGNDKWAGMGQAGLRPAGDDRFSTRVESWRDWQRVTAPGFMHCYAYWMDMRRDRDGHYWGNILGPDAAGRLVPERGRWLCVEQRVELNTPGQDDGELAVWLDGELHLHYRGLRWRSSAAVRCKRVSLSIYVHEARRDNVVWFDDLVVSTGYVGP